MPRPRTVLVSSFLIVIGIVTVAFGFVGWASVDYSYTTQRDAWMASVYLTSVTIGLFSMVAGSLLMTKLAASFLASKRPNACLSGALGGAGGAIALISAQPLFYYLLKADYFSFEWFVVEASVGVFLVLLAVFVSRRKQ